MNHNWLKEPGMRNLSYAVFRDEALSLYIEGSETVMWLIPGKKGYSGNYRSTFSILFMFQRIQSCRLST